MYFLAEGFEEIEALATVDLLRRAGINVETVSINPTLAVKGAHGVEVAADIMLADCPEGAKMYILPGGMPGATNLAADEALCDLLKVHKGKLAAICASPGVVLAPLGLLEGREVTCYPGFDEACRQHGAVVRDVPVMALNNLITGNGPSAALRFALAIVANSLGESTAQQVGSAMLFYPKTMNFYF